MEKRVVLALFILSFSRILLAQESDNNIELITDSTFIETDEDIQLFEEVSELDPQRAALLSAILPGMGQLYNKQYWKIPLIFGGMVAFGHFIDYQNNLYHAFRNAAIAQSNGLENPFLGVTSSDQILIRNRDSFRRDRDFLIILGSVFYLLNIVDAHVSAHLDEFNVNHDLVISLKPSMQQTAMSTQAIGASFVIRF